ncbi:type VI secretion system baseplate subunit TssE [Trinickia soli]|uniref:Type VI secretion system baseplate subunit TssE n=1 Tax=Trinickia soli TaxID=380675 RepID=A0A2N7VXK9_9BURK|nr:type VI secretion system baseplate subunit TssE [Trinickia soli]PMS21887.1 type VI secretion system baseplate subunit TssE [Trinickia soli]CAB3650048.1 hypothetical protein LMG24076_00901 [Trinickia soli]
MAELTTLDRLQPALLDRLSDDAPHERTEPRAHRVISMKQLRASVLRDVSNLLNAHALYGCASLAGHPLAEASVLNYGLRDLTGRVLSSLDDVALAREIERSIVRFESRIAAATLRVTPLRAQGVAARTSVAFLVEGELWGRPFPERLCFKTELDLESGEARLVDDVSPASRAIPQ